MARLRSSPHTNKLQSSPRDAPRNRDSPARQLQTELERTFASIQLHDQESRKLYVYHRKVVQDELDARECAQAVVHKAGIDDAVAKHELIRQQALTVLEAHIREEEERRRREAEEERWREAEEKRRAEEERMIREENERKAQEARDRAQAARRVAAEKAKAEQEEKQRKEREATAKREQKAREKAEADAAAAAAAAAKEQQQQDAQAASLKIAAAEQQKAASITKPTPSDASHSWSSDPETRHKHYLAIHAKLKTFRRDFWASAKKDPQLKTVVGDMRRAIRTSAGQLTLDDKRSNLVATTKIKATMLRALREIPSPPVILNDYLPPHLSLLDKNTTTTPSLVLYLYSIFSKAIVSAFANEASVNNRAAEPLGTMAAHIFGLPELQFTRHVPSANSGVHYDRFGGTAPTPPLTPTSVSLVTILVAKLHASAPQLFGINGNERTTAGRLRLRWRRDGDPKSFVPDTTQYDRLVGLGAGYASISLRNFSKAKMTNPYPPIHFWESLGHILNTPPNQIQTSHILLLKNMLENSWERIILFYGNDGVAAMREAVVDFPKKLPAELASQPAARALMMLAETWEEKNLSVMDWRGQPGGKK